MRPPIFRNVAPLPSQDAESGLLHVHALRDKPRRKPWAVKLYNGAGSQVYVATAETPVDAVALAAVADKLRRIAPGLTRRQFRETAKRLADNLATGQAELPLPGAGLPQI